VEELVVGRVAVAVYPLNREGDGDVGVVDRAGGLVETVDGTNVAVLARDERPGPLALSPGRLEDLQMCQLVDSDGADQRR
jgi:hypothetical protein